MSKTIFILLSLMLIASAVTVTSDPVQAQRSTGKTIMVPMPDGVELATEVYLPDRHGSFPTLLVRTPYGRLASGEFAESLTEIGIAVVSQDTRGRYDSQDEYAAFFDERADGQATLEWILAQTWSNGQIATFGGSALGIAQYMMAPGANEALRCQWIDVGTPDLYSVVFQNGVWRYELVELWLESLGETDLIAPFQAHPRHDDWWLPAQITGDYAQINTIAVHVGGWYDIFAPNTVEAFRGYQTQSQAAGQQHLIMGPWTHTLNEAQVGDLLFPDAENSLYEDTLLLWMDACLLDGAFGLGTLDDLAALPPVSYYTMGAVGENGAPGNEWHEAEAWPPPDGIEIPVYLHPNNYLSADLPASTGGADTFTADPADPVPTLCGANLNIDAGVCDQREIERRADVIVYSTPPLDDPVEVTGDVTAAIWISADTPDTDLAVRITDVYPDGRSMLVMDGIMRARYHASPDFTTETWLEPGEPVLLTFDLGPTSIIFNAGHRIRVSIAGSNAPRFSVNPNTGADFLGEDETGQIAQVTIWHDAKHPSAVILPVR